MGGFLAKSWSVEGPISHILHSFSAKTHESIRMWHTGWAVLDVEFTLEKRDVRMGKFFAEKL